MCQYQSPITVKAERTEESGQSAKELQESVPLFQKALGDVSPCEQPRSMKCPQSHLHLTQAFDISHGRLLSTSHSKNPTNSQVTSFNFLA